MNLWEESLFINGKLCQSEDNKRYAVINPFSEAIIGHAANASKADALSAIDAARFAFDHTDWAQDAYFRLSCLKQLKFAYIESKDEMHQIMNEETGIPMEVVKGIQSEKAMDMDEVRVVHSVNIHWEKYLDECTRQGALSQRLVRYDAAGVVAAIPSRHISLEVILDKILPALVDGCTLILRVAPETPLSALFLGRLIAKKTNIPAGVVNILTAEDSAAISEILIQDERVDMLSLTSVTKNGKETLANATGNVLKKVQSVRG